jgi:hypothetical protein
LVSDILFLKTNPVPRGTLPDIPVMLASGDTTVPRGNLLDIPNMLSSVETTVPGGTLHDILVLLIISDPTNGSLLNNERLLIFLNATCSTRNFHNSGCFSVLVVNMF